MDVYAENGAVITVEQIDGQLHLEIEGGTVATYAHALVSPEALLQAMINASPALTHAVVDMVRNVMSTTLKDEADNE